MLRLENVLFFKRKVDNPYTAAFASFDGEDDAHLRGVERSLALVAFSKGELPAEYDVWYAPWEGGAKRVTREEVFGFGSEGDQDD